MRDGRPNPDIWGNIITCGEIAVGIYEIVGTKKRGLEVPKAVAEEILPESVLEQAAQDGENLCFTDPVSTAIVAVALLQFLDFSAARRGAVQGNSPNRIHFEQSDRRKKKQFIHDI